MYTFSPSMKSMAVGLLSIATFDGFANAQANERPKPYHTYNPDPYNPDPYNPDPYNPDPYNPDPYIPDPYPTDPYTPDPYTPDPYPTGSYTPDPYSTGSYTPDPYPTDSYTPDPYPTDPYPTGTYPTGGGNGTYGGNGGNGTYGGNNNNNNTDYTPIIGFPDRVVERRPVTLLDQEYPDIFNMFILAMESIQNRAETEDESYFQIGGIHGWPFVTWQYPQSAIVNPNQEYCTHSSQGVSSVIFTTWHRPYLVLLEQVLHEEALRIAGEFTGTERERYLAAADDVRLPYWDWASEEEIPSVVLAQTINVVKPNGPTDIANPLFSYAFQQSPPNSHIGGDETARHAIANERMVNTFPGRQLQTHGLFNFGQFNDFNSALEGIHGSVHGMIGETMSQIDYSAFDPTFWLHHCNVDRLYSLYQATNPGVYLTPGSSGLTTLQLPAGAIADLNTPLYPFRDGSGNEWTSEAIKDLENMYDFGYSYPETPADLSGDELNAFTARRINELYGPNTNDESFVEDSAGNSEALTEAEQPNARTEWGCNFVYDKEELPGSYLINVYLNGGGKGSGNITNISSGNTTTNSSMPQSGSTSDLVGVAPIFTKVESSGESNLMNYTVPLTPALIEEQVQLRPEETIPKLRQQLYWTLERVDTPEPVEVPLSELKSLKVSVVSKVTDYKESDVELPEVSRPLTYVAPVVGKPGAITSEEDSIEGEKAPAVIDEELVTAEASERKMRRSIIRSSAKMRFAKI